MPIRKVNAWTNRKTIDPDSPPKCHLATTWWEGRTNHREEPAWKCASSVAKSTLWSFNTETHGPNVVANLCTECVNVDETFDILIDSYDTRLQRLSDSPQLSNYMRHLELAQKSCKTLHKLGLDVDDVPYNNDEFITRGKAEIVECQQGATIKSGLLFPTSTVLNLVRTFGETATVTTNPPVARRRTSFYTPGRSTGGGTYMDWADSNETGTVTIATPGPGLIAASYGITPKTKTGVVPLDAALMIGRRHGRYWNPTGWSKLTITPHGPLGQAMDALGLLTVVNRKGVHSIDEPTPQDLAKAIAVIS